MEQRPLRGAIVGLQHLHPRGYMTLFRACPDIEITCVCEPEDGLREAFCAEFGLQGHASLERLLASERLDLAVLFLPHAACEAAAVACAERGLHLMVEKPAATSSAAIDRMAAAAARHNVVLTTGYAWRYHPAVRQIKSLVEAGFLGTLVSFEARLCAGRVDRYRAGHSAWMLERAQSGGGPMMNLGVHWLDLIRHLTGEEIREVCAVNTHTSAAYDIEDSSLVLLRLPSGAAGVLSTSYLLPDAYPCGRDLYLALRGSEGVVSYAPRYEGEQAAGAGAQTETVELYSSAPGLAGAPARKFVFQIEPVAGYSGYMGKAYVERFVEAVRAGRAPDIGAEDAAAVLRAVEAIYRSAETRQWIEVSA
jgi:predicted dehydrogenase